MSKFKFLKLFLLYGGLSTAMLLTAFTSMIGIYCLLDRS